MLGGDERCDDQLWNSILQECDQDGNGQIDLQEFKDLLLKKF